MSALLLKANELNHRFTSLIYKSVPIYYSKEKVEWRHESNIRKLLPYCFINWIFVIGLGILRVAFLVPFVFITMPERFGIGEKLSVVMFTGTVIPSVVGVDFLLLFHGAEIAAVNNWAVVTKRQYMIPPIFNHKMSSNKSLLTEFHKLLHGVRPVDWTGMIAILTFYFLTMQSLTVPLSFVPRKLDIWHITLKALSHLEILDIHQFSGGIVLLINIFIYMLEFVLLSSVAMVLKTMIIVGLLLVQFILELYQYLWRLRLTHGRIKLYKEGLVAGRLLHSMIKLLFGAYLGLAYYLLLFCMIVMLLGYGLLPWKIYALIPSITLVVAGILLLIFYFGCETYETSGKALESWRRHDAQIGWWKDTRKILRSLRPFAFPVGEVGIMDSDIKLNYLSTLQESFVSVLILAQDVLV